MDLMFTHKAEAVAGEKFVENVNRVIIDPIIMLLFAAAFIYFLWGVAQYLLAGDSEEVRSTSKTHMLYGVIGLFIMVSVFGILNLIIDTITK